MDGWVGVRACCSMHLLCMCYAYAHVLCICWSSETVCIRMLIYIKKKKKKKVWGALRFFIHVKGTVTDKRLRNTDIMCRIC